jgi:Tfp pilus assembly protein PilF
MKTLVLLALAAAALPAQEPAEARVWLDQGVEAFRWAEYREAVADFEFAIVLDPDSVTSQLYLGTAYLQQYIPKDTSSENEAFATNALAAFHKALEFDPRNRRATTLIAALYLSQKKLDLSQEWYRKALALPPGSTGLKSYQVVLMENFMDDLIRPLLPPPPPPTPRAQVRGHSIRMSTVSGGIVAK